jgi:hypothetical protein
MATSVAFCLALARALKPHNGMVRRGILEALEFEDGGSHETTRDRYRFREDTLSFGVGLDSIGFNRSGSDP